MSQSIFFDVSSGKIKKVSLVKEWPAGGYFEIGSSHFSLNSAVFLPNDSERNEPDESEDIYSSGIVMLERAIHLLELAPKKFLIAGHTDRSGDFKSNSTLSEYRAQGVYSILIGDRELFKSVSNAPHIHDKEKKHNTLLKDKLQIADWSSKEFNWPCTLKENDYDYIKTFRSFQKSYNKEISFLNPDGETLEVDGDWGPKTWGAVFDCYQYKLSQRLTIKRKDLNSYRDRMNLNSKFVFSDKHYIACGEYHPIDRPEIDDVTSKSNRRVEILFFDEDNIPELKCKNEGCSFNGCSLFNSFQSIRGKVISANWEHPLILAGHTDHRKMKVHYNGNNPGENVEFSVIQVCEGELKKILEPVKSMIIANHSSTNFEELSENVVNELKGKEGQIFYSYFFIVKGEDWMTVSARLHSEIDGAIYE